MTDPPWRTVYCDMDAPVTLTCGADPGDSTFKIEELTAPFVQQRDCDYRQTCVDTFTTHDLAPADPDEWMTALCLLHWQPADN